MGNPDVGFGFEASPFGSDSFDLYPFRPASASYQDMFTGFLFYKPLEDHRHVLGVPGVFADGFDQVIDERRAIAGREPLSPDERTEIETRRELTYEDYNPEHWQYATKQIARWR